jgi:hypothetical protein
MQSCFERWSRLVVSISGSASRGSGMTKLLEKAMEMANSLPPEMRDNIARMVLLYAGDDQSLSALTPDEETELAESEAEADRGEFATDEQVRAIWAKHGL